MLGFGLNRLAAKKRKERRVGDLYNATQIVNITPVLRGHFCMQGPIEEPDLNIQKNMVISEAEKRFGKRSMKQRSRMSVESGTCNVCSAPCSSCMHLKRALMGSKTDEFSDETCRETTASHYSINDGDVLPSCKGRPCDSLQHTASEASNMLSVNSSHDTFSENAESKATMRSPETYDALEDFEMHPKLSSGAEVQLSPKPGNVSGQRILPNKTDDFKGVEGHDDNISCTSRANDANTAVGHHDRTVDIKNFVHSSASECSLGPERHEKASFSHKLDLLEVPLLIKSDAGASSPKMHSPFSRSQSDKCHIGDSTEVARGMTPKSEPHTDKGSGDPPDEAFKCRGQDEQELSDKQKQEPLLQAMSGNESDESDIVEHDVKVCDICGDAGREDLLAICSKCSDGAEHTYCMREMLRKVPEGNWLCEECQLAEDTESQKQGSDVEGKRTNKTSASTQSSDKRHAENLEAAPASKRQAIETSLGSPKSSIPCRMPALSRDSSFKSLDKGKVRPSSFSNHSSSNVLETARSTGLVLLTPKGTLLKSNSFSTLNSKPKVKAVDEVVPQKHKGNREQTSLDMKEGHPRMMGKSMSFRSNPGRSSTSESKFKMLSPRYSKIQDLKPLKQVKGRNAFERKDLPKLDRPLCGSTVAGSAVSTPKVDPKLTSRCETTSPSSANNRESKVMKSEGKLSTLSKSTSNLSRKALEVPVTPVGALSASGNSISVIEQRPNIVIPKDEPLSSSSWTAERPSNNSSEIVQDVPRSVESTNQGEKTSFSHPRPNLIMGSKGVICQKCKEVGHDVDCCPVGSLQGSGIDVSARRNSREEMVKGNKLKAAIVAAIPKLSVAYGRNRVNDQMDGSCMTSMDLNCERASQDLLANKTKNMIHIEGEVQSIQSSISDSYKQTTVNHLKPFSGNSTDVVLPLRAGDSNSVAPSVGKTAVRDLSGHAFAAMSLKMSAFPEHEYIWQGIFEVHRGGKLLDLCGGMQAHLSSCASPKVLEVVNKFPQKIHLNEVPRLSTWPMKFHEDGAKEDNIALYFFAKDLESYERNYNGLLDSMIKNDLALKGNQDGVEILIFPSSQLPENCQRWNMLFFLWGVFRVRKLNCSDSSKTTCVTGSNMASLDRDVSADAMSLSNSLCLSMHVDKDLSACDGSCDIASTAYDPDKTCMTGNGDHDNKVVEKEYLGSQANCEQQDGRLDSGFSAKSATIDAQLCPEMRCILPSLEEGSLLECGQDTQLKSCLQAARINRGSNKGEKTEMLGGTLFVEDGSSVKIFPVGTEGIIVPEKKSDIVKTGREPVDLDRDLTEDVLEKQPDIVKSGREPVDLERDLKEDGYKDTKTALQRDLNLEGLHCWQSNCQKRPHLDLTETAPQPSVGTSQKMSWNEVFVDQKSTSKKLKTGFSGTYVCSSSRDRDSFSDGISSQIDDLGPCSSVEEKRCVEFCDEKVIPEDMGTTERYFFPVGSQHAKDFHLDPNGMPWKELSLKNDAVPNLELALGAETKPQNKGMLPLFVGVVDKNNNQVNLQDKVMDKEEDDVSASLSLSLAFPFSDKEQTTAVPKTEQLLPERHHVNTSLLLYGGFSDK
ncbi:hypothetical protein Ddye_004979 [Dipteronia dyeriana]|uniref:PHD-type domain-containing protein n=1 Tax=Dipteronia dyeriana TaxID=168575 RepID=A0AAD9XFV1_9ROSI|nr:hypothetical protein Ddye_004979 [Dipteronia dyeriana]